MTSREKLKNTEKKKIFNIFIIEDIIPWEYMLLVILVVMIIVLLIITFFLLRRNNILKRYIVLQADVLKPSITLPHQA